MKMSRCIYVEDKCFDPSPLTQHRNWTMRRYTRRCWSQPLYLMVAECWITSTPTSRTSVSRWADKRASSSYQVWVKVTAVVWILILNCFFFIVCRLRPLAKRWQQHVSHTPRLPFVLVSVNLPPRKPKSEVAPPPQHTRTHTFLAPFSAGQTFTHNSCCYTLDDQKRLTASLVA